MEFNSSTVLHPIGDQDSVKKTQLSVILLMATAVIAIYLKFSKSDKKREKSREINVSSLPGPKYFFPLIGNALQLLPISNTLKAFEEWCRKYGPLVKVNWGGTTFVILNTASSVEALLKSNHIGHVVKNPYIYKELDVYLPNKGLINSKGQAWKTNRKILSPSMSIQSLKHCMPKINKQCVRLVDNLKLLFEDGQPHAINTLCSLALFDIVGEMITGLDLHGTTDGRLIHDVLLEAEEMISQKILKPWISLPLIWNLHPYSKGQQRVINIKDEWLANIIQRRRNQRAVQNGDNQCDIPTYKKTVVDLLLESNMSDALIADEILVMFIAGHDTSASAIHFFCFLMALHPQFQAKCRQEINSVLGDRQEVTWDDVNDLKYLEQCISESMRVLPTVPITARTLEEPLVLDENQVLPVGTNVLTLPYTTHRNPEYFPNPDKFDPGRFTPEEIAKRPNCSFIPFLMGQRICLGFKFAMIELKVVAAYILRNFELSTKHTMYEIPALPKFLMKAERDYIFSFKKLS